MSETIEGVAASFPKTVTACHAEITRLRDMFNGGALREFTALETERDELKEALEDAKKENAELEAKIEKLEQDPDTVDAIHSFLDECERVGPQRYDMPQSDRAMRAVISLHHAVGRNP